MAVLAIRLASRAALDTIASMMMRASGALLILRSQSQLYVTHMFVLPCDVLCNVLMYICNVLI